MVEIPVCLSNTELYYVVLHKGKLHHVRHGYSPRMIMPRFLSTPTLREIKVKVFQYQYGDNAMSVLEKVLECLECPAINGDDGQEYAPAKIPIELEKELRELVEEYRRAS